ncbi:hypothetical protein PIB30_055163 [Stylosanthes scabra]|uniref:Uncharacterized protein n=1 Tax=Stylosanthes scabra TaxID=79078 RepID=A0ABU6TJL5_9FABA|nr:hypothetical protein [Stylosanthes scabra]
MANSKTYLSFVFALIFLLSSHVLAHELPREDNVKDQKAKDSISDWVYPSISYNPTTTTTTQPPEAAINSFSQYIEKVNNDEDGGAVLWHRKMMKPSKTENKFSQVSTTVVEPSIGSRGTKQQGSYYGHVLRVTEPPIVEDKAGSYYNHLFRAEPPVDDGEGLKAGRYSHLFRAEPPVDDGEGLKLGRYSHLFRAEPPVDDGEGLKAGYYSQPLFRAETPSGDEEDPRDAKEETGFGKPFYSRDDDEGDVTYYGYRTFRAESPPDENSRDSKVSYGVINLNEKVDKERKN